MAYEPQKDRQHNVTGKGYDVTLYKNWEDKFCVTMIRPNFKRDIFVFDAKCDANKKYNTLLRLYA